MAHVIVTTYSDGSFEYLLSGSNYENIPFVGNISASGGEAPESEVPAIEGVGVAIGKLRLKTMAVELASYVPIMPQFSNLRQRAEAGTIIKFRIKTQKYIIYTSVGATETVAIAADGTVTFAAPADGHKPDFGGEEYGKGMVIAVGGANHVVRSVDAAGMAMVTAPAAAVAATDNYVISAEAMQLDFSAKIRDQGGFELGAENPFSSSISLKCTHYLPDWSIAA